jgi:DNA repair exonuclease SbcCD ATPase subunit
VSVAHARPNGSGCSVAALDADLLRQLCLTRPDEFVGARNALAKQLRGEGDREGAAALAALRRPSWTDWALNSAASEHAELVDAFAEAAASMRAAQERALEGGSVDLRAAINDLRERSAALARAAGSVLTGSGRGAALAELTERLNQVAADEAAANRLRSGILLEADADGGDLFAGVELGDRPSTKTTKSTKTPTKTPTKQQARKQQEGAPAAKPDPGRAERRRQLEAERKQAERQLRAATRDLDRVDATLRKAQAEVDKAEAALERARQQLTDAEAEHGELRRRAADAEATLGRTLDALDDER